MLRPGVGKCSSGSIRRAGDLNVKCACALLWLSAGAAALHGSGPGASTTSSAPPTVQELAQRVDRHYDQLHSLKAAFTESYAGLGMRRTESGTLLLRKPGRMRWDYSQPAGKVFLLDGKYAWFYARGDAQVQRIPAKQLDDLRSPLRFLLGHTELQKELTHLAVVPTANGQFTLTGQPKGQEQRIPRVTLTVTPAGAITAIALAAGHTPSEIEAILQNKDFAEFLDGSTLLRPYYLMFSGGLYLGNAAQDWIETDLLRAKIARAGDITMKDLPLTRDGSRAVLYACRSRGGTVVFDSDGDLSGVNAAFAARCSMSIPLFFVPQTFQGERIYDGGLRHNFPVARFILDNPEKPFLALYLKDDRQREKRTLLPLELYDIWMDGDELKLVDSHKEHIVTIDPDPIGTTDFDLSQTEKDFLVMAGRAAALRFLWALNTLDGPTKQEVEDAEAQLSQMRNKLCSWRGRLSLRFRRWRQLASVILPFVVFVGAIWKRALIAHLLSRLVYFTGL